MSLPRPARRAEPMQRLLFGGVYGTVLASALAAALENDSGPPNPGYDAAWILVAALAAAASHGYAHALAHRVAHDPAVTSTLRSVLTEWPLVVAALPTGLLLLTAQARWWSESSALAAALAVNTVALFGWGLWATRAAGRGWVAACRSGCVDMLFGLFIIGANTLSK
ncbi:hypothetical protein GCM10009730_02880 [Streptomyces albidochromogenes]|uniref:hypothetical protein n=1 Tax=Streptomyces albidochromogenes TaxID=329524 RepID=UPI001FCB74C4|nr:hypothetical protein [Streptomyces albidochromogenes]